MNSDLSFLSSQLNPSKISPQDLALMKAIQASAGFTGYNLEAEAALLLPFFAGWRARVPTDKAGLGADLATWKVQLGYGSVNQGLWGSAEASIGLATTPLATQIQAPFLQQSLNGDVTYIAMLKALGFDDPMNIEVSNVLSLLLKLEELISLTGNNVALAVPAPVALPSTATALDTFAAGTWHVKVSAITNEGAFNNASSNSNRGETLPSASIAVVVPAANSDFLDVSWPAIPGAVGYKVYCEAAAAGGTFYLVDPATGLRYRKITSGATDLSALGDKIVVAQAGQTYVTVNHVQIYTVPLNTQPTPAVADGSANALTFEGALAWAEKTTIYSTSISRPGNIDMDGAPFTTVGTGILEIDRILEYLWNVLQISPTLMIGSSKTIASLGNAILKTSVVPTYQVQIGQERGAFTGGIYLGGYTNKYIATMVPGQNALIPTWAHPYIPDGTLMLLSEDIPAQTYRYSRKGKAFSLEVLAPYTYWELARTQLSIPFAILWSETLKCHHPQAQVAIQGARVDQ